MSWENNVMVMKATFTTQVLNVRVQSLAQHNAKLSNSALVKSKQIKTDKWHILCNYECMLQKEYFKAKSAIKYMNEL